MTTLKTFLLVLVLLHFTSCAFAQIYGKRITDRIPNDVAGRVGLSPIGFAGRITYRAVIVPISVVRLERAVTDPIVSQEKNWRFASNLMAGLSIVQCWGNGVLNPDSSITADPVFFVGLTANFGTTQIQSGMKSTGASLTIGGTIGFNPVSLFLGAVEIPRNVTTLFRCNVTT